MTWVPRFATACVLLLGLQTSCTRGTAGCSDDTARKIGVALGAVFVRQAEAFAELNIRAKDCSAERSQIKSAHQIKRLETLQDQMDATVERMNEAFDSKCLEEGGPYEGSVGFHLFQTLEKGLSSDNALVRWNVLERTYWLCEGRELLPDSADRACRSEVETAALTILSSDHDPINRHRALEILADSYGTVRSKSILQNLSTAAPDEIERSLATAALQHIHSEAQ